MTLHQNNHIARTLLAMSLMVITGGAPAAQVPPGTQLVGKQELIGNNGSEPASLSPHRVGSSIEFNIISDLFEGLVSVTPAGATQPRLAERWESKGDLLWTFHLHPGLTWPDGMAITAQDIVWSWRRLVSPATASPYASYPGNMYITNTRKIALEQEGPETLGVKALNDTTLQVTLNRPNTAFLAMLAHPPLIPIDKVLVECFADKWTRPEHIVTSGPCRLTQWVANERLVAERNAKYWDNAYIIINKVTYLLTSSEIADVNRYKAGEIDIVYTVPINQFARLQKTMDDQLDVSPQLATYYYELNTTRPPFNDARVRRALNMALDKDIIVGKVLGWGQYPAQVISQPDIGGVMLHNPDYAGWSREKRVAEAKKLLVQVGCDDSHPLVFTLLYNAYESHQRIVIAASSMRKKNLGVEVKLQNQEWKTMLNTMHAHSFDAVRYAWIVDYDDAATFLNTFRTGDSENTGQHSNLAYDEALRNAAKASDVATRGKYYQQAEDPLAQDVPAIPVCHYVRTYLVKPRVGGFTPDKLRCYYTKDMYTKKQPSEQRLWALIFCANCLKFRRITQSCLFSRQLNEMVLYSIRRGVYSVSHTGSVAERLKAPVLETGDPKGSQSSNLCAPAI